MKDMKGKPSPKDVNVDKLAELKAFVHKTLKENDAIYRRLSKI